MENNPPARIIAWIMSLNVKRNRWSKSFTYAISVGNYAPSKVYLKDIRGCIQVRGHSNVGSVSSGLRSQAAVKGMKKDVTQTLAQNIKQNHCAIALWNEHVGSFGFCWFDKKITSSICALSNNAADSFANTLLIIWKRIRYRLCEIISL